ncbi:hypothetical protein B0J11DRAFT_63671 [Dendryphion nanum]|uniref:Uncharacterized protein n=1 Tax=Dendryphion nanum TaxID=256645 RepID=A0A9P9DHZ2_9PLEO|nr:hypothetical protein B0J11DRAFT_63671 [Dendryphion nanum]
MSTTQRSTTQCQNNTPPSSFSNPLTPPPTDEKRFARVHRILKLFENIRAGQHSSQQAEIDFQLTDGDYLEIRRRLDEDDELSRFVENKIRYDYNGETYHLVVRMPTGVHELFIDGVEDAIRSQLKVIRRGSGSEAEFARKVRPARSTEIEVPVENAPSSRKSKYEPDASFWHEDAQYPGVIIEVAYSQKKKRLDRLARDYILGSDASVRVVVGLDIEYSRNELRKATLSVWRPQLLQGSDGPELDAVKEVVDKEFRDENGNPTGHPGLKLRLSDFACEELTRGAVSGEGQEITLSTRELCQYLAAAEEKTRGKRALVKHTIPLGVKKRKRSETPQEKIASDDEARYVELEERAAKRIADKDLDYEDS